MIQDPKGIDAPIQDVQEIFIDELWADVSSSKKQFNGRVFGNLINESLTPEVHVSGTNDYKAVKFNDKLSVLSWFDVNDETESFDAGQVVHNVGIFFAVNLKDLYPDLSHRAVEEAHGAVIKLLDKAEVKGIVTGAKAYGDFDIKNLKHPNMHPWHIFRIDYTMKYSLLTC